MSKVIGVTEHVGEYKDKPYHFFRLHTTTLISDATLGTGFTADQNKVKLSMIDECLGKTCADGNDLAALIGKEVSFGYDKYQNINQIRVLKS